MDKKSEEKGNMVSMGRYQVGNFVVQRYSKSLNRAQLRQIRMDELFKAEKRDIPKRVSVPYIKVMSVSDNWEVHYAAGCTMFRIIDEELQREEKNNVELVALFTMIYADTMVFGDRDYWQAKSEALDAFMSRQDTKVDEKADAEVVEEEKLLSQARDNILEMADSLED